MGFSLIDVSISTSHEWLAPTSPAIVGQGTRPAMLFQTLSRVAKNKLVSNWASPRAYYSQALQFIREHHGRGQLVDAAPSRPGSTEQCRASPIIFDSVPAMRHVSDGRYDEVRCAAHWMNGIDGLPEPCCCRRAGRRQRVLMTYCGRVERANLPDIWQPRGC